MDDQRGPPSVSERGKGLWPIRGTVNVPHEKGGQGKKRGGTHRRGRQAWGQGRRKVPPLYGGIMFAEGSKQQSGPKGGCASKEPAPIGKKKESHFACQIGPGADRTQTKVTSRLKKSLPAKRPPRRGVRRKGLWVCPVGGPEYKYWGKKKEKRKRKKRNDHEKKSSSQ